MTHNQLIDKPQKTGRPPSPWGGSRMIRVPSAAVDAVREYLKVWKAGFKKDDDQPVI